MSGLNRAATLVPALVLLVILSGCSAPTLPANAGNGGVVSHSPVAKAPAPVNLSKLDACKILSQADSETLIGTKLLAPLRASNPDTATCTYPGDPNGPTAQVEIFIGDGAKQQLAIDKDKLKHPFTQPTGLGDEAWQEDQMIWARKGSTWVSIQVVSLDDASKFTTPLQTAMAIALKGL